jgi:Zinc dependent phospholipase C
MQRTRIHRITAVVLIGMFVLGNVPPATAYSVLTHEQIVDFAWEKHIRKVLLDRYPDATPEDLRLAHAYAYGGCVIQDMGYYPYGNKFFSNLVHYVRSGDFVAALLKDARDINELAFALGALAHYAADVDGHPTINAAVAREFPGLRRKYGNRVTYEDDPSAHIRTEFGFDVLQIAKQQYTSQAFHDFIGFNVAQPLLERAFAETYGLELKEVMPDEDRAVGSYRRSVSKWIPRLTNVALLSKKKELQALPNFEPKRFRYLLSRSAYEREWGKNYDHPGFGVKFLAFVVKILPKVGPLKTLDIKPPTPETERMYVKSVESTVAYYDKLLTEFEQQNLALPNVDFDTGKSTVAGEYKLADETYAGLLQKLASHRFSEASPELRTDLLSFYSDLSRPVETKKHKKEWRETENDLQLLKAQSLGFSTSEMK